MSDFEHRELVRRGYDQISRRYRWDDGLADGASAEALSRYEGWIAELTPLLPPGGRVLDLGCGAGLPAARLLVAAGFEVVGVDFSAVQIERARALVPKASFVQADLTAWDAEPASFDAVVSFYALIHVPLADQRALFPRIRPLAASGRLLARDRRASALDRRRGVPRHSDVLGPRRRGDLSPMAAQRGPGPELGSVHT
jgi:SAM-dependent methyltransferase